MNRLYAVESTPTSPARWPTIAWRSVRAQRSSSTIAVAPRRSACQGACRRSARRASEAGSTPWSHDLERTAARAWSSPASGSRPVHALAHAINEALGNVGQTVVYTEPVEAEPVDQLDSLRELVADMEAGQVDAAVDPGRKPGLQRAGRPQFAERLEKVGLRIHLSLYDDETAGSATGTCPRPTTWRSGATRAAYDGTAPSSSRSSRRSTTASRRTSCSRRCSSAATSRALRRRARDTGSGRSRAATSSGFWQTAVHDGVVAGTGAARAQATSGAAGDGAGVSTAGAGRAAQPRASRSSSGPIPTICDGRFANNGWLQELPKPLTQLTWDNAAQLSARQPAERLGVGRTSDVVELELPRPHGARRRSGSCPGQADECGRRSHLGYGRTRARAGRRRGVGFNAYPLRTGDARGSAPGLDGGARPATQLRARLHAASPPDGGPRARSARRDAGRVLARQPGFAATRGRARPRRRRRSYPEFKLRRATRGAWRST